MDIDLAACVSRGATGAVGAIPGTVAAHPFDVLKMRMQITGDVRMSPTLAAVRTAGAGNLGAGLYRGVSAGVAQKVATRGPMFLCSELSTQFCMSYGGLSRERALFVGSFLSGYLTGSCAGIFEWDKVQRGAGGGASSSGALARLRAPHALRRLHAAGVRNGVFDATFFGGEHLLRHECGLPPEASYALAAALALSIDFPIDVHVQRAMAAPPNEPVGWPIASAWRLLRTSGPRTFAGLHMKVLEFALSYAVTGACSRFLVRT